MAEHTPGPWYIDERNDKGPKGNLLIRDDNGHTLAEIVLRDPSGQDRANAGLMAAGPTLLEALKEAQVYLDDGAPLTALTIIEEAIEAAQVAVRKVSGGANTARQEQLAERENQNVEQFLAAIGEVCRKHGYSIGHEDGHGAFIINTFAESDLEWLGGASIELDSDEAPQPTCTCTLANVDYINDCPVHDARTMAKYEEARAEREMVQAMMPVVNEDGE